MEQAAAGSESSSAQARVLVVDDSAVVRAMIGGHLLAAGHRVDQAPDGNRALELLAAAHHDVVVTDLRMPGMDGFELMAAAKRLDPDVEVIILTGAHSNDMEAAVRALRMGAHDYLTKPPPRADDVVLTVERALEKRRLRQRNRELVRQLEVLSLTDALTGVSNRRAFEAALEREVARAQRHKHSLGVLALDIDHFKKINDTHGHAGGDVVLRWFAATVTAVLRKEEALYRCGGEEFAVILPQATDGGLQIAGERIVRKVASTPVAVGEATLTVTTSCGGALLEGGESAGRVLERADAALYAAKGGGRNRMVTLAPKT